MTKEQLLKGLFSLDVFLREHKIGYAITGTTALYLLGLMPDELPVILTCW